MRSPKTPLFDQHKFQYLKNDDFKIPDDILTQIFSSNYHMITGGETKADHLLETFINEKVDQYWEASPIRKKVDIIVHFYLRTSPMETFLCEQSIRPVKRLAQIR